MGILADRLAVTRKLKKIYLLQDVIFDLCSEEGIEEWFAEGIPDEMEFSDAIDFYLDRPEKLTEIYNLAIRLLRRVEL